MYTNRISAVLSAADLEAIETGLSMIRQKLPFLTELARIERRKLPHLGDKNRAFVLQALDVARQNPDILPRAFDVDEMQRDMELADALRALAFTVHQLQEQLIDAQIAAGADAYSAALLIYGSVKNNGQGRGLDAIAARLGSYFSRKSSPRAAT